MRRHIWISACLLAVAALSQLRDGNRAVAREDTPGLAVVTGSTSVTPPAAAVTFGYYGHRHYYRDPRYAPRYRHY